MIGPCEIGNSIINIVLKSDLCYGFAVIFSFPYMGNVAKILLRPLILKGAIRWQCWLVHFKTFQWYFILDCVIATLIAFLEGMGDKYKTGKVIKEYFVLGWGKRFKI